MNYLAHLHLSNNDENLIIGNYIADDVKGNEYLNYTLGIQQGILLHRKIDDFTDAHQIVTNSKNIIRNHQNKFTPVVMDVFYDYFLAKKWADYSNENLLNFTNAMYQVLFNNIKSLPLKSQQRLPHMAKSNWLYNYRKVEGIKKALTGMSKRTTYTNNMHNAHTVLIEHETELEKDFELFFPELQHFVSQEIKNHRK